MENSNIIEILELTAKLHELHGADDFKIRSFASTAYNLDKITEPLAAKSIDELAALQGVGKSMAKKILEIASGHFQELNDLLSATPEGLLSFFKVKGLGPKKIKTIWQELQITDINELLIACQNGEIAQLKGFGAKIQDSIIEGIAFAQNKSSKLRLNKGLNLGEQICQKLQTVFSKVAAVGDLVLFTEEFSLLEFIVANDTLTIFSEKLPEDFIQDLRISSPYIWKGKFQEFEIPVSIYKVEAQHWNYETFIKSVKPNHLLNSNGQISLKKYADTHKNQFDEKQAYEKLSLPYIIPEMREGLNEWEWANKYKNEDIVSFSDLKGVLHNHSTYSDGMHSLSQMAEYVKSNGYEYFGIADHSKVATYAKGLSEEKVIDQIDEINRLNNSLAPFKILKGIEADILGDGALDYSPDFLKNFDYVVASIHSNLKMNQDKAVSRIIKAIENPATTILGHPSGRVLLEREGYPLDYKKMIEACAANQVVIEINASPYRLDLDWRWIYFAMEKGVMLSINPDAHAMEGIHDMKYGTAIARKAGLIKQFTFNALSLSEIEKYLNKKHKNA